MRRLEKMSVRQGCTVCREGVVEEQETLFLKSLSGLAV